MQISGSLATKTRTRIFDTGNFRGHTDYLIESEPGARPAPQAFLVHQRPGWTLPVHFHLEDQFQVVVGGAGTLGRHEMAPVSVHYASREAGYGPLVAGAQGLDYLTLRVVTDPGAWYLPEARARMQRGIERRQETVDHVPCVRDADLQAGARAQTATVIEPDASGLAGWLMHVPPSHTVQAPAHAGGGGGRFHVVVGGALDHAGQRLDACACVFASHEEAPLALRAGAEGAQVLVLQFATSAIDPVAPALPR